MGATEARVRRTAAEKRRIVELTYLPGQSVARVALAEGVNSHQVFQWRRAYRNGLLEADSRALLPVVVTPEGGCSTSFRYVQAHEPAPIQGQIQAPAGAIHIEFPGRAVISVESGADIKLLRAILESLRK